MSEANELRAALAAIQRAKPRAFARLDEKPMKAGLNVASVAQLTDALVKSPALSGSIAVGSLALTLSEPSGTGVLAGLVAVVSGAGSGLGLGIARGLYGAGACVAFTDIDSAALRSLEGEFAGSDRAAFVAVDVTNEQSVAAAFDRVLARFGRVDCVACCAGIAPAFDLVDFPVERFRLACEVNLTGYFLYAREAARIMTAQGHGGSMIMLSSKSGMEPSKANTAYNATKAGELHMARGWALELGRVGIRVNCIAPGNVFEGSKIWNAEYIAKAAQKRGIKPEEVIPYYNNLTALNREIKPTDIANAAVFLAGEQARCVTGQVLVVDSGQVWAR
jgi:NAD(P)-dependent dehydrogenase (short-subunit alcohol dehydrogenase family)